MTNTQDLFDCITRNDVAGVTACLAAGASADGSRWRRLFKSYEPTPLLAAVKVGATALVELLLDHGANPDLAPRGWPSPLAMACNDGHREIVELLLTKGGDIESRLNRQGTPLAHACWYHREDLVELLLARGADPQRVMKHGVYSLLRVSVPILRRLIAAGGQAPPEILALIADEDRR